jgi:hypothetical protein
VRRDAVGELHFAVVIKRNPIFLGAVVVSALKFVQTDRAVGIKALSIVVELCNDYPSDFSCGDVIELVVIDHEEAISDCDKSGILFFGKTKWIVLSGVEDLRLSYELKVVCQPYKADEIRRSTHRMVRAEAEEKRALPTDDRRVKGVDVSRDVDSLRLENKVLSVVFEIDKGRCRMTHRRANLRRFDLLFPRLIVVKFFGL